LGFPLFVWAFITHMSVVPAVSDATGLPKGPALFFLIFLGTPVLVVVAFFALVLLHAWISTRGR
jgi:hypothetical protein